MSPLKKYHNKLYLQSNRSQKNPKQDRNLPRKRVRRENRKPNHEKGVSEFSKTNKNNSSQVQVPLIQWVLSKQSHKLPDPNPLVNRLRLPSASTQSCNKCPISLTKTICVFYRTLLFPRKNRTIFSWGNGVDCVLSIWHYTLTSLMSYRASYRKS